MADDTTLVPAATRRDRLSAHRRRRRTRVVIAVAAFVVASGAAVAAASYNHSGSKPVSAATNGRTADDVVHQAVGHVKTTKHTTPPRVLTHAAPLNLWIGGDSLAGEIGPALGKITGATGVVHAQVDYKVSSGLASNDIRDWQTRAVQQMAQYNPEVVVFEVGTNDASIVNDTKNADGTPAWQPVYRVKVARMMNTFVGDPKHPRTVFWVGAPTMSLGWRDKGVQALNEVMKEEAQKRAPNVIYVDAYSLFSLNGQYSSSIRTLGGNIETVRIGDGVHLTDAGANYLGLVLFSLLDQHFDITKHADPAEPINWDESLGSSGNSGSSGSSGSCCNSNRGGGSQSGNSNATTPDTPAPPSSFETTVPSSTPGNSSTSPATSPSTTSPATTPATTGSSTPPPSSSATPST
jgi:hypothetical protein